jgi:SAM-dependent methyltransferase
VTGPGARNGHPLIAPTLSRSCRRCVGNDVAAAIVGDDDAVDLRRIVDTEGLRRRRYERLARLAGLRPTDRVIDIGCGPGGGAIAALNTTNVIVGVDLLPAAEIHVVDRPNFSYRQADATDLSAFADDAFDVAFAIGLLEHIRPDDQLARAIGELRRVGRRYCAVVPHRAAFIEPHFQMPFFSLWPDALKVAAIRRATLGTQGRRPDGQWQRIHWLSGGEWLRRFDDPTARARRHWYGPLLMYTVIVGGRDAPAA